MVVYKYCMERYQFCMVVCQYCMERYQFCMPCIDKHIQLVQSSTNFRNKIKKNMEKNYYY